ncbi:MAG: hypothetical protein AAF600_14830 [Bacteroidota bacterium]
MISSLYANYGFVEKYIFIQITKDQEPGLFQRIESSTLSNLDEFLIPSQHLINPGASYKFQQLPLWLNLEINNLLNRELYDNYLVPKQPINFQGKIRYRLM